MKKIAAIGFALLMVFAVFVPVVSALNDPTKEGYQSVVNPNPAGEKSPENIGHLDVLLACRAPQIGGEFTIVPVAVSAPFTNAARVDKGFVDQFVKQFGEPKTEQYLPDGTFDSNYAPGTYLLKQVDGNGGQPEFALVTLKAASAEVVVFLGHGITPADEPKAPEPVIVVKEAKYGATRTVVDVAAHTHTVHHDAVTEQQFQPEVNHTVEDVTQAYKPAEPAVYRTGVKLGLSDIVKVGERPHPFHTPIYDYPEGHVHANNVGGTADSQNRFVCCGQVYEINNGNGGDAFMVTGTYVAAVPEVPKVFHYDVVVDVPAHYHTVTVTEAYDETINHAATYKQEGEVIDVTAQVQEVVDTGVTSFKFMNGPNPGGIFSTDNVLLKTIVDPAYGQLKNVHIEFTVDGGAKQTINTQENQVVNLI